MQLTENCQWLKYRLPEIRCILDQNLYCNADTCEKPLHHYIIIYYNIVLVIVNCNYHGWDNKVTVFSSYIEL